MRRNVRLAMPKIIHKEDLSVMKGNIKYAMEEIMESDDTFHSMIIPNKGKSIQNAVGMNGVIDEMFGRLEFEDRTPQLRDMYNTFNEMLKETIGAGTNPYASKKERVITNEVETQQDLSNRYKLHSINMRKMGFEKVNEVFGLNIQVETQYTDDELLKFQMEETNNDGGKDE